MILKNVGKVILTRSSSGVENRGREEGREKKK